MKHILKSTLLLGALSGLVLGIGYFLGGRSGLYIALGIATLMNFSSYWFSDKIVLAVQKAKPLDEKEHAEIVRMVQDLALKDNLPMPRLFMVDSPIPNAFATGRSPKKAVVAVTSGIVEQLSRQELKSVLAHELGHVKNNDILISSLAATAAAAISVLADMLFWGGALFGGGDEDRPNPIAMIAIIVLAPLAATLIQLSISRSREFLADEHGARLIGHGHDLASALEKLENFKHSHKIPASNVQQSTAHLMFINMFNASMLAGLFSTHPKTADRVARLRSM